MYTASLLDPPPAPVDSFYFVNSRIAAKPPDYYKMFQDNQSHM